ncbi:MAG TPA: DUF2332 family protein [Enhygromyxa sp.]|nr:DUF2332 family protein [Enhygromyxa sp.]
MSKDPAWERHRSSLAVQAGFVRSYSPLTAALLDQAVDWLADPDARGRELGDPAAVTEICERLVALLTEDDVEGIDTGWIDDLQPALRLNACLHAYVLDGDHRVVELRPYFATVAEGQGPDARKPTDEEFAGRLLRALAALGPELFECARSWRALTNETSRGLAWLLPAALVAAEEVHLVELGCSAGLNLYAEQRSYNLAWSASKRLRLGRARDEQFLTLCSGPTPGSLDAFTDAERNGPEVLTRVGGDLNAEELARPESRRKLEAGVWGDQRRRLDRLREGMELHSRAAELDLTPAEVRQLELPGELPEFLAAAIPSHPQAPVITYNTCVTAYLSDVNQRAVVRELRGFARSWSLRHKQPWMWVRFEPARAGKTAPHPGWCSWIVELFSGPKHKTIELGWAHPHLIRAEFGPGLVELRNLRDRR